MVSAGSHPTRISISGHGPSLAGEADGAVDRVFRRTSKPVAAIFIHAGAGYHSVANEKVHLEACSEAARVGIKYLKAGASAAEAVEAAIKSLEDKEITNAGFGSNLNMDGVVECDATIVDHFGRSGACGAVPGIKNPISLAKLILDTSSQPLSLRRVPPNILVGLGAKLFAEEHGMVATLNDSLVSKNAKDRYIRWNKDLRKAEARQPQAAGQVPKRAESEPASPSADDYEAAADPAHASQRRDHTNAILTGTWNEGQPDSPSPSSPPASDVGNPIITSAPYRPPCPHSVSANPNKSSDRSTLGFIPTSLQSRLGNSPLKRPKVQKSFSDESTYTAGPPKGYPPTASPHDGSRSIDEVMETEECREGCGSDAAHGAPEQGGSANTRAGVKRPASDLDVDLDTDLISDTIGAIAIDMLGNIAAGSSSGGIGMKHRGRIGPAALVGIGTAVIPEDPEDEEGASVAAVTSGTGEHMATCLASAKCAERLFTGTRRGPGGRNVEEPDEHNLMEAFILDDFMGHPGVRNQPSAGAIGVMAVKKDRTGIYFYFAHNTDSFALASMSSSEREPLCVMSRQGKVRPVAQGGRRIRID
ncbi:nucleophile aminohydrolase [Cercophora newfieldiana]|uniref:Nucleophile aminohydrolase n=1 Tax=Cercophora newfieldiana TaxID=92897 RepID=A0AA39YH81_9PEZI|nr:nucleophile aminohydrolase [Cercophora newfieldiana]